ncbi:MAG: hypothetical protein LJE69_01420, partial [Thiohalocapsa sp.]|uniref:hypothetical protein n=1 Tax=Thiohalocapsa sp. TaxID=2497641 RepID=UPI0025F7ED42
LLERAPELWSAGTSEGGREAQKEIDYNGSDAWRFGVADLTDNPKETAQPLKADVERAFQSLMGAIDAVDG